MTPMQLSALLMELLALPQETEWVEWKHNNDHPEMIAQRLSGLANSVALHGRDTGFMLWRRRVLAVRCGTRRRSTEFTNRSHVQQFFKVA